MKIFNYYGKSVSAKANAVAFENNGITVYFSYETIIAIKIDDELFISKNIWGSVTGRHLNAINDDKSIRIDYEEIERISEDISLYIER